MRAIPKWVEKIHEVTSGNSWLVYIGIGLYK